VVNPLLSLVKLFSVAADANTPAAPDLKITSKAGHSQKIPAKSIREAASNKAVSAQLVG